MRWPWFDGRTLRSLWSPILAPQEKWWRDLHIQAHVLGGVLWAVLFRFFIIASPNGGWMLDFRHSVVLRLLGVGLVQLTLWEMIQRENWRPELLTPPGPPGTGYPWLSAGWDVAFTVLGATILESVVALVHLL